ncbi:hypothetical protein D5R81_17570 [Parashewanella spongiae]|uniref:Orphan protein n=1 Tax=Parashewanella spongiae TaxID=342950 RepID=A0A3A6T694_9GAMM|nr:DUF6702 family protein [Parashewanella spongiae]MCL1079876.1 hypothetical protein [Parashewanella spongiae]RJY06657.1 hypothetical protein D5R81_17570 [Parashewanella spongiae]
MRLLLLMFVLLFAGKPLAHQQKEAYTNIKFNQRTDMLEIQHRFYLHDAEHAAQRVIDKSADLISDPVSREAFAYYATSTFSLKNESEMTLALEYVGTELQGKYLWVYQETPITKDMNRFYIKMTTLQEIWSDQVNHINIERNKKVNSVRLHFEDKWQQVLLRDLAI